MYVIIKLKRFDRYGINQWNNDIAKIFFNRRSPKATLKVEYFLDDLPNNLLANKNFHLLQTVVNRTINNVSSEHMIHIVFNFGLVD